MEENIAKKRKAAAPTDGEKSKVVAKLDTDDNNDDKDDNGDSKPSSTSKTDDKDTKLDAKDSDKSDDDNEEDDDFAAPIKQFPDGPRKYILNRAAGDDVLQNMDEHMAEGVLEIDGDSARFWVKFPDDCGEVAARIDCVGEINDGGDGPPTHFKDLLVRHILTTERGMGLSIAMRIQLVRESSV